MVVFFLCGNLFAYFNQVLVFVVLKENLGHENLKGLHVWAMISNSTNLRFTFAFRFKSQSKISSRSLSLTIWRSTMNVIPMESFIKHQH